MPPIGFVAEKAKDAQLECEWANGFARLTIVLTGRTSSPRGHSSVFLWAVWGTANPMKRRKRIGLAFFSLLACCGLLAGAAFAALHSPSLLTPLARAFGYDVQAHAFSFSPTLSGSIAGLSIKSRGEDRLTLLASSVTATNSLDFVLRGELDSLVLQNPKLTFRIGNGPAGTADLSFLAKLPSVRRLEIQNGEALLIFEAEHQQVKLDNMNITIRDFSSKGGGSISFQSSFAFERSGGATFAARGKITGDLQLAGLDPRPHGRGTIELAVESGTYTRDNRTVSLDSLVVATDLAYDQRTETLTINSLHGESKSLGSIQGTARAALRDDMPWSANLSVASIDFAKLVGVLKPFLPEEYRTWTVQGVGAVETEVRGALANAQPSLSGTMTFSFTQGGFSSPDSTKAAQGISARLVLGLTYVAPERKLAFTMRGEQRDGEYLWGTYYSNLGGRMASLTTDGAFFFSGDGRFALNGLVDVFQTGDYSFRASGTDRNWGIQLKADVSHARLVETLLREYLKGLSPDLGNLSLTGTSSLEATVRREDEATVVTGTYRMAGAALNAPDMQLSVQEIAANVPFDLTYPPGAQRASPSREPGFLRLRTFQRRRLSIDQLEVPLVIAHNMLEVPEPVQVPFFGGRIHLYGLRGRRCALPDPLPVRREDRRCGSWPDDAKTGRRRISWQDQRGFRDDAIREQPSCV